MRARLTAPEAHRSAEPYRQALRVGVRSGALGATATGRTHPHARGARGGAAPARGCGRVP
ncbi:hypothetical protein GCM10010360_09380 [Streptomyces nogalater]